MPLVGAGFGVFDAKLFHVKRVRNIMELWQFLFLAFLASFCSVAAFVWLAFKLGWIQEGAEPYAKGAKPYTREDMFRDMW